MRRLLLLTAVLCLLPARPVAAQFGLVESLFSNVTDISFYTSQLLLLPHSEQVRPGDRGIYGIGVELLFQVGALTRPLPDTVADTTSLQLVDMTVTHSGGRADTTWHYEPVERTAPAEELWTLELAVGYGQLTGFELRAPGGEILGTVRELPAVSFYASHVATGVYAGVRTGMLQTHALQVVSDDGAVFSGSAESFQVGATIGYAHDFGRIFPFLEAGWMLRQFPGIDWAADALPPLVPRELSLTGWQFQAGVQVALK